MSVCRRVFARTGAPASTDLAPFTVVVPRAGQEHCAKLVRLLPPILTKNCKDVLKAVPLIYRYLLSLQILMNVKPMSVNMAALA